jgi:hypothetical protein
MNPNPRDRPDLWLAGLGGDIVACINCRFWEPAYRNFFAPHYGECRRKSPRIPRLGGFAQWPTTRRADFCGEFRRDTDV